MYGVNGATTKLVTWDYQQADIPDSEKIMLSYGEQVAKDANRVTDSDVENLKKNGYTVGGFRHGKIKARGKG